MPRLYRERGTVPKVGWLHKNSIGTGLVRRRDANAGVPLDVAGRTVVTPRGANTDLLKGWFGDPLATGGTVIIVHPVPLKGTSENHTPDKRGDRSPQRRAANEDEAESETECDHEGNCKKNDRSNRVALAVGEVFAILAISKRLLSQKCALTTSCRDCTGGTAAPKLARLHSRDVCRSE